MVAESGSTASKAAVGTTVEADPAPPAVPVPDGGPAIPAPDAPNPPPGAGAVVQSPETEETSRTGSPAAAVQTAVVPAIQEPAPPSTASGEGSPGPLPARKVYQVVKGDSLAKIARLHKVTVQALKEENHLKTNDLQIGQPLVIPSR